MDEGKYLSNVVYEGSSKKEFLKFLLWVDLFKSFVKVLFGIVIKVISFVIRIEIDLILVGKKIEDFV